MNKLELKSCTATQSCIMDPVQRRARGLTESVRVCVCVHGQRLSACVGGVCVCTCMEVNVYLSNAVCVCTCV